jgi:hypothetical protein
MSHVKKSKANKKKKKLLFIYRNNILWDRIAIRAQEFAYTKESDK